MSKSLVEMTTEIIVAQVRLTPLSLHVIVEGLYRVFETLYAIRQSGSEALFETTTCRDPQSSIQHNQVVCLECGNTFKLLSNRHLALHGLTPRSYKHKHGIRMTQALSAQTLSARRSKLARQRGMGKQLAAWRAGRKRQAG
jgi:predicted transcriptional regulator